MTLIFENLLKSQEEINAVIEVSKYLKVNPNHLMFLMWFETAHTLNPQIVNYQHGDNTDPSKRCKFRATGLIQFMPRTSIGLGTTNEKLFAMSFIEQLEYVRKHLAPFRGKYKDYVDLYCAIFWPAAVGKPDSYTITSDIVAKQNPIFDINKDGDIEKAEIRAALKKQIPKEYSIYFNEF